MDNKTNQRKIIYLQRQGTSHELNSNNAINDKLHYFICIRQRPIATTHEKTLKRYAPDPDEGKYSLEMRYCNDEKMWGDKKGVLISDAPSRYYKTFKSVRKKASQLILQVFRQKVSISKTIEKYCHGTDPKSEIDVNDKYLAVCIYDKKSDTIRLLEEDYCLIDFNQAGTEDFIQINTSTAKYLSILKEETENFKTEMDGSSFIKETDDYAKERLAWLIGESIKSVEPYRKLLICDSLIRYTKTKKKKRHRLLSARHFNSVEKALSNLIINNKLQLGHQIQVLYKGLENKEQPDNILKLKTISSVMDEIRKLSTLCVTLEYKQNYEKTFVIKAKDAISRLMDDKKSSRKLSDVALYCAVRCIRTQIDISQLKQIRSLSKEEEDAYRFLKFLEKDLAEYLIKQLPGYRNQWEIK